MASEPRRRIVFGIGNPGCGDDAAGRVVARRLRGVLPDDVEIVEHDGEATGLLAGFEGAAAVWLVDACLSGAAPGTIRRLDAGKGPLPRALSGVSTHGFGPAEAVELARALGRLPARCIIYAIEGASFATGAPPSPSVAVAIANAADLLRDEFTDTEAEDGRHA